MGHNEVRNLPKVTQLEIRVLGFEPMQFGPRGHACNHCIILNLESPMLVMPGPKMLDKYLVNENSISTMAIGKTGYSYAKHES